MIPDFPKIRKLDAEDRHLIYRHLRAIPRRICELSIGNLFIWEDFDRPQVTCINRNVCVLISPPTEPPYFLEPLGRDRINETAEICLRHAGRISRVSADYAALLPADRFEAAELRGQFDYIYLRQELAELKGKKFDGKRNHIRRFTARFPAYFLEPLTPAHREAALKLFEKWFAVRKESKYFPKLAHTAQRSAVGRAFSLFEALNLKGSALMVGGKLEGFTLGSTLNQETVSVHFLYGNPELPGVSQTLLQAASNKTFSSFKYLDLEQDLGIPGLRTAKLSYHPMRLEKKYEIKARGAF